MVLVGVDDVGCFAFSSMFGFSSLSSYVLGKVFSGVDIFIGVGGR